MDLVIIDFLNKLTSAIFPSSRRPDVSS